MMVVTSVLVVVMVDLTEEVTVETVTLDLVDVCFGVVETPVEMTEVVGLLDVETPVERMMELVGFVE
jgi:hypothetical protein